MLSTLLWSVSGLAEQKKTDCNLIMARLNDNIHANAADVHYDSKACCWVDDAGHYYDIEDWENGVIKK